MNRSALPEDEVALSPRKRTKFRKILLGIAVTIAVLGLSLGLGLGFTTGQRSRSISAPEVPNPSSTTSLLGQPSTALPWRPKVNDTWQITLLRPPLLDPNIKLITPDVTIFDVDLFDTTTNAIELLHDLNKKVICYFSAGSFETWRPDAASFRTADKGKELEGWPGETWLNISSENVRSIMRSRVELASAKRCDGVDPDNVDGYVSLY